MNDFQNSSYATIKQFRGWLVNNPNPALIIKAVLGAVIIALSAQISIPIKPVPITGQTLGLIIVGLSMGRVAGVFAVVTYLLAGAAGLPVFAGGSGGFMKFFGPSGGYLYGFLPFVFVLGYFSDKGCLKSSLKTVLAILIANVALYFFGLIQLSIVLNLNLEKTLAVGLYPFIVGDTLKALLATVISIDGYKFFSKIK